MLSFIITVDNFLQLYMYATYVNKYPMYLLQLPYTFEYNFDAFCRLLSTRKAISRTERETQTLTHTNTHARTLDCGAAARQAIDF